MLHNKLPICFIISGILVAFSCVLVLSFLPFITRKVISQTRVLLKGSTNIDQWALPDYEIRMDFWLFNVSNADAILLRNSKPNLQRKGPYSYREIQQKVSVNFLDQSGTLEYRNNKTYVYNQSNSCPDCFENDTFIVPNVPFLTAVNLLENMKNMDAGTRALFTLLLLTIGEHPFTVQTAGSLIFQGYDDQLFSLLQHLKFLPHFHNVPKKMGFMYPRNATDDGLFEILTGTQNVNQVGQIVKFDKKQKMDFWTSDTCNKIQGTDGSIFPPFIKRDSIFWMFVPDICRSIYASYYKDIELNGLQLLRYTVPRDAFDAKNPQNEGYCQPSLQLFYPNNQTHFQNTSMYCLPSGLLNVSQCRFGAPVVVSNHNFLYSPSEVKNSVEGLAQSTVDDDGTFLDIEPTTGVLLRVIRRIQVNVAVYNISRVMKYVKPVIIPVLMINESAIAGVNMQNLLYNKLVVTPTVINAVCYTVLAISILIVFLSSLVLVSRRSKNQNIIDPEISTTHSTVSIQNSNDTSVSSLP